MSATRTTMTGLSLFLLALIFVAVVILANAFLRGARIDLTENNLYTLSDGSKNILGSIDEPVNLYYFFSDQASRNVPSLRTYATRVRELLDEFVLHSNGKLKLHAIDPVPFTEEEDRASRFGLQAIPVGASGEAIYFGLAGTNSVDGVEVVRFFQPDKEAFLEYDLTKLVYTLANPERAVVGLMSWLPLAGGMDPMTRQPQQPWVISDQIGQLFEVRQVAPTAESIDPDIDVLMLVHPKEIGDQALYAVDQFILGGGKAMLFVDPHADGEVPMGNPQMAMFAEKSSNLSKLLDAWGVKIDPAQVVGDATNALSVSVQANQAPVRHLGIISMTRAAMAADDVITSELSTVILSQSGSIARQDDAKVELTPLISSSDNAALLETEKVRFLPDPAELLKGFQPSGDRYVLAARLSGSVPSAFPDGAPEPAEDPEEEDAAEEEPAADSEPGAEHLAQSKEPINVVLVADTDLLTDRLWVRMNNFFGQRVAQAWSNNADFVVNTLDNLFGNSDLIGMRSRATSNRPFGTVDDLKRQADDRFRAKEQELEAQLQETEQALTQLQQQREDAGEGQQSLILSPEHRAEIENFQQKRLEIRKELRKVRRDLDSEIERLGSWFNFINIAIVPILLRLLAIILSFLVRSRRRAAAAS